MEGGWAPTTIPHSFQRVTTAFDSRWPGLDVSNLAVGAAGSIPVRQPNLKLSRGPALGTAAALQLLTEPPIWHDPAPSDDDEGDQGGDQGIDDALSLAELQTVYHLPSKEAARALNVSLSRLKRSCRAHNVLRWPHRKLSSLHNLQDTIRNDKNMKMADKQRISEQIKVEIAAVLANPDHSIDPRLDEIRQAKYKLKYYHKTKHIHATAAAAARKRRQSASTDPHSSSTGAGGGGIICAATAASGGGADISDPAGLHATCLTDAGQQPQQHRLTDGSVSLLPPHQRLQPSVALSSGAVPHTSLASAGTLEAPLLAASVSANHYQQQHLPREPYRSSAPFGRAATFPAGSVGMGMGMGMDMSGPEDLRPVASSWNPTAGAGVGGSVGGGFALSQAAPGLAHRLSAGYDMAGGGGGLGGGGGGGAGATAAGSTDYLMMDTDPGCAGTEGAAGGGGGPGAAGGAGGSSFSCSVGAMSRAGSLTGPQPPPPLPPQLLGGGSRVLGDRPQLPPLPPVSAQHLAAWQLPAEGQPSQVVGLGLGLQEGYTPGPQQGQQAVSHLPAGQQPRAFAQGQPGTGPHHSHAPQQAPGYTQDSHYQQRFGPSPPQPPQSPPGPQQYDARQQQHQHHQQQLQQQQQQQRQQWDQMYSRRPSFGITDETSGAMQPLQPPGPWAAAQEGGTRHTVTAEAAWPGAAGARGGHSALEAGRRNGGADAAAAGLAEYGVGPMWQQQQQQQQQQPPAPQHYTQQQQQQQQQQLLLQRPQPQSQHASSDIPGGTMGFGSGVGGYPSAGAAFAAAAASVAAATNGRGSGRAVMRYSHGIVNTAGPPPRCSSTGEPGLSSTGAQISRQASEPPVRLSFASGGGGGGSIGGSTSAGGAAYSTNGGAPGAAATAVSLGGGYSSAAGLSEGSRARFHSADGSQLLAPGPPPPGPGLSLTARMPRQSVTSGLPLPLPLPLPFSITVAEPFGTGVNGRDGPGRSPPVDVSGMRGLPGSAVSGAGKSESSSLGAGFGAGVGAAAPVGLAGGAAGAWVTTGMAGHVQGLNPPQTRLAAPGPHDLRQPQELREQPWLQTSDPQTQAQALQEHQEYLLAAQRQRQDQAPDELMIQQPPPLLQEQQRQLQRPSPSEAPRGFTPRVHEGRAAPQPGGAWGVPITWEDVRGNVVRDPLPPLPPPQQQQQQEQQFQQFQRPQQQQRAEDQQHKFVAGRRAPAPSASAWLPSHSPGPSVFAALHSHWSGQPLQQQPDYMPYCTEEEGMQEGQPQQPQSADSRGFFGPGFGRGAGSGGGAAASGMAVSAGGAAGMPCPGTPGAALTPRRSVPDQAVVTTGAATLPLPLQLQPRTSAPAGAAAGPSAEALLGRTTGSWMPYTSAGRSVARSGSGDASAVVGAASSGSGGAGGGTGSLAATAQRSGGGSSSGSGSPLSSQSGPATSMAVSPQAMRPLAQGQRGESTPGSGSPTAAEVTTASPPGASQVTPSLAPHVSSSPPAPALAGTQPPGHPSPGAASPGGATAAVPCPRSAGSISPSSGSTGALPDRVQATPGQPGSGSLPPDRPPPPDAPPSLSPAGRPVAAPEAFHWGGPFAGQEAAPSQSMPGIPSRISPCWRPFSTLAAAAAAAAPPQHSVACAGAPCGGAGAWGSQAPPGAAAEAAPMVVCGAEAAASSGAAAGGVAPAPPLRPEHQTQAMAQAQQQQQQPPAAAQAGAGECPQGDGASGLMLASLDWLLME